MKEKNKNKSLDGLLKKSKKPDNKNLDNSLKSRMDNLIKAQKTIDGESKAIANEDVLELKEKAKALRAKLKKANQKVKELKEITYQEKKVIDDKKKALSNEIIELFNSKKQDDNELSNQIKKLKEENEKLAGITYQDTKVIDKTKKDLSKDFKKILVSLQEDQEKEAKLSEELHALKNQINSLKKANKAASDAAIEAADNAAKIFEDKEFDANRNFKNEISDLENQIKEVKNNLAKENKENKNLNNKINSLNKALDDKTAKLQEANKNYKKVQKDKEKLEAKYADYPLNVKKELDRLEVKYNKTLDAIKDLKLQMRQKVKDAKKDQKALDKLKYDEEKKTLKQEFNKEKNALKRKIKKLETQDKPAFENQDMYDEKLDELTSKLSDSEDTILNLEDKIKDMEEDVKESSSKDAKINSLEEDIKKLEHKIKDYHERIQNNDAIIDENVVKEFEELQTQLDAALDNVNTLKAEKEALIEISKDLSINLEDQEHIILMQEKIIDKQQKTLMVRNDVFKERERQFHEQENIYHMHKENYENDKEIFLKKDSEHKDAKKVTSDVLTELEDAKFEIVDLKNELEIKNDQLEKLTEEKKNQLIIIDGHLKDIAILEKQVNTLNNSDNDFENNQLKNQLLNIKVEFGEYKNQKNQEINELQSLIEELKIKINNCNDVTSETEISQMNIQRLKARIEELQHQIEISDIQSDLPKENILNEKRGREYIELLNSERKAHRESEAILGNQIQGLKTEIERLNSEIEKYSSSYLLSKLNKQIATINSIIESISIKGVPINRDIYNDYYEEALRIYSEQKSVYEEEISKRNELLLEVKEEKLEKIKENKNEVDNPALKAESSYLLKQVKQIDNLILSNIKTFAPLSSQAVETEVLKLFKKQIISNHKLLEDNIRIISDTFKQRYTEAKTIEELVSLYHGDCKEMAIKYGEAISKLDKELSMDKNYFSNVVKDEKMLMLISEFQTLVKLRDENFAEVLPTIKEEVVFASNENFNDNLDRIDRIKKSLNNQMNELQEKQTNAKTLLLEEEKRLDEDIEALKKQIERLNSFEDNDLILKDRKKVQVILAGKQEKKEYIEKQKAIEIDQEYEEKMKELKDEFSSILEEESKMKETYQSRIDKLSSTKKISLESLNAKNRTLIYQDINSLLLDYSNISSTFDKISYRRQNIKQTSIKQGDNKNLKKKVHDMWVLYDRYKAAKQKMEEDFEDIRKYNAYKAEAAGDNRKYINYIKTNETLEGRINAGLDTRKNLEVIKSNIDKANNLKHRIEYLNNQANMLAGKKQVNEYIELVSKLITIEEMIKESN